MAKPSKNRLILASLFLSLSFPGPDCPASGAHGRPSCWPPYGAFVDHDPSKAEIEAGFKTVLGYRRVLTHSAIFTVDGRVYRADQELGSGVNRVWRGKDESGRWVVMKQLQERDASWVQQYEKLVTEYFLLKHVRVPRVIGMNSDQNVVIKEYFEGVTREDLEYHYRMLVGSRQALDQALQALALEKERLQEIHQGFQKWLEETHPELPPKFLQKAAWVIKHGDLKDANFIYDPRVRRWTLIDP